MLKFPHQRYSRLSYSWTLESGCLIPPLTFNFIFTFLSGAPEAGQIQGEVSEQAPERADDGCRQTLSVPPCEWRSISFQCYNVWLFLINLYSIIRKSCEEEEKCQNCQMFLWIYLPLTWYTVCQLYSTITVTLNDLETFATCVYNVVSSWR